MHGRIFELIPVNEPIVTSLDSYIEEETPDYADYAEKITDPKEIKDDIAWLVTYLQDTYGKSSLTYDTKTNTIIFHTKTFADAYFKRMAECINQVNGKIQDNFNAHNYELMLTELWNLKRLLNNHYGFHIFKNYDYTLDEFLNILVSDSKKDFESFKLGSIYDYHW